MAKLTLAYQTIDKITADHQLRGTGLPRRTLFAWAIAILFSNYLLSVLARTHRVSIEETLHYLGAIGMFQYIAWYVVLRLLGTADAVAVARRRDLLVIATLCLFLFLPTNRAIWIAASGMAIYLWWSARGDPKLRGAAIVLGALCFQEFWGHILFNLVAVPLLRGETAVVATLLEVVRPGTTWEHNVITGPHGFGIIIYAGCSSFHNFSLAMLCWLTISQFRDQNWRPRDFVCGMTVGATIIALNLARLFLMSWNLELYHYWHDGIGAGIFEVGASATILLLSLYGSRPATARK